MLGGGNGGKKVGKAPGLAGEICSHCRKEWIVIWPSKTSRRGAGPTKNQTKTF